MLSCDPALNGQPSQRMERLSNTLRFATSASEEAKRGAWARFLTTSKQRDPVLHSLEMQGAAENLFIVENDLRTRMFDDILNASEDECLLPTYAKRIRATLRRIIEDLAPTDQPQRRPRLG